MVRVEKETLKEFWAESGLRMLFSVFRADIKKEFKGG